MREIDFIKLSLKFTFFSLNYCRNGAIVGQEKIYLQDTCNNLFCLVQVNGGELLFRAK